MNPKETMCRVAKTLPISSTLTTITSMYCDNQENFRTADANSSSMGIFYFINMVITFFAFFLAFKCISKGGNAVGHLLGACCCGVLYIAYALANSCM